MRISDWSSDVCSSDLKGDGWQELGLLDVEASTPTTVVVDTSGRAVFNPSGPVIREGDRLRFKSLMETYSRTRRETATTRRSEERRVGKECVRTCRSRW